jgi:ferrochelatase
MTHTAVVLLNLGGPDSLEAVEPFLFNLFNDKAIIGAPSLIRRMLATLISKKRAPIAQDIYAHMGGHSPILPLTEAQAKDLDEALSQDGIYKSFVCMRYWHPMSDEVAKGVKDWGAEKVILLPLYPQFSTATTGSSFEDWHKAAKKVGLDVPTLNVCCYPIAEDFLEAHAATIREEYQKATEHGKPRILFSAHGLPEKIIKKGDPYQWQVEQTAEAVIKLLGIYELDALVCYQSRVGPLKWIGPNTEDEIIRAAKDETPLVVVPIAFVSEHSETLVELDIEYKEVYEENGGTGYFRVPALGTNEAYIQTLRKICVSASNKTGVCPENVNKVCPAEHRQCPYS